MKATELLHILKVQNKRLFIIWLVTFFAFICLLGYTIWLSNDIGTIYDREQDIEASNIEYSDIINGDYYGED